MSDPEALAALQAQYAEMEDEFKRGELLLPEWNGARRALEKRIADAGGKPPGVEQAERLQEIGNRAREKMVRTTQLYAVEWLRRDEMLDWLAEQFDAAGGDTVERLEAMLVALRARIDEP